MAGCARPAGTTMWRFCVAVFTHASAVTAQAAVGPCASSPCQYGGTCVVIAAAAVGGEGNHRILSEQQQQHPSCDAKTLHQVTDEINAQCCGADDTACANGMPTSWYVGLYMFLSRPPCVPDFAALRFR